MFDGGSLDRFSFRNRRMPENDTSRFCTRIFLWGGTVIFLSFVLTACLASGQSVEQQGTASYYADKFEGRMTANGETYDPDAMTAAHPHLPFGTRVRVTRIDMVDEPSVVVRVNDRGPFSGGRIIDLSKAAARELDMMQEGVVEVRIEVVEESEGDDGEEAAVESGAGWK